MPGPAAVRVLVAEANEARVYNIRSWTLEKSFTGHVGRVRSAVISPDGMHVLTASKDGLAKLLVCSRRKRHYRPQSHALEQHTE